VYIITVRIDITDCERSNLLLIATIMALSRYGCIDKKTATPALKVFFARLSSSSCYYNFVKYTVPLFWELYRKGRFTSLVQINAVRKLRYPPLCT